MLKKETGEKEEIDLVGKKGMDQMYPVLRFFDELPDFDHLRFQGDELMKDDKIVNYVKQFEEEAALVDR